MGNKIKLWALCSALCVSLTYAFPADQESLVVSSTETPKEESSEISKEDAVPSVPKIYEMNVESNVTNRFAKTSVTSRVKNLAKTAQEATFSVVLPEKAYISEFVMEIGGKSYKAYVKEKEEAKKIYNEAIGKGQAAAHVEANARDSNRFTVSVNVEPQSKAIFTLTYEELLERQNEQYEIVINIHPGQPVKDLNVLVNINESRPLKFVKSPPLRSGNEIAKNDENLISQAKIDIVNSTSATVKFSPDIERQKQLASGLGTKEENGLAGQFIIQYDVERDPQGGEVLVKDGYFVHFFAPSELPALPKQVVFVLDTSGSMDGNRIVQLKEAMNSILAELKKEDIFNIVEFSSTVRVWNIENVQVEYELGDDPWSSYPEASPPKNRSNQVLPSASEANEDNIKKAKQVVEKLNAYGGTDIKSALEVGLKLVKKNKEEKTSSHQPIIVFLTDGEPTVGETYPERIISSIAEINSGAIKSPIFSLSFGDGADRDFLQKISLKNLGFARHIYEAADASLQLQEFYREISSPLLSNVHFKYVSNVTKLTKTTFPIFFRGSELVIAGRIDGIDSGFAPPIIIGDGIHGPIELVSRIENPVGALERLWAYLTVKQVLEARDAAENKTMFTKKALDLALKYSFVTPVSSLVVVKPNDTRAVDTQDASKTADRPYYTNYALSGAPQPLGFGGAPAPTLSLAYKPVAPQQIGYAGGGSLLMNRVSSNQQPTSLILGGQEADEDFESLAMPESDITSAFGTAPPMSTTTLLESTTTLVPSTTQESDLYEDIKTKLPWLKDILSENGTLTSPPGNYQLSLDATVTNQTECHKTPGNGPPGICTLLPKCPQVFSLLTDVKVFEEYFCALEESYVGICCPTS